MRISSTESCRIAKFEDFTSNSNFLFEPFYLIVEYSEKYSSPKYRCILSDTSDVLSEGIA
jgi:hypothetical protein